jgi:NAD(P)H-dependent nitrite reductase small subunit
MAYHDTAIKLEDLAVDTSVCVEMEDLQLGLFRTPEGLFAIDNVCPHHGAPLHEGFVSGEQVTCPWHQWQFRLRDGVCSNIPGVRTAAYPVEVREGTIWVNLEKKGATS